MFRGAGKKLAHHFPKVVQVEWSVVFCLLPGKGDGLLSLELRVPILYSSCSFQPDVTAGRSLDPCLGLAFFFKKDCQS